MPNALVNRENTLFTPSTLLTFYVLDCTPINLNITLNLVDGTNSNFRPITLNGVQYLPFPVKLDSFGYNGDGTLTRPKITVANINGFVSNLLLEGADLVGASVTIRRIYARFIDAVNFPNNFNPYGTPDPTAQLPDETYFINRKIVENKEVVQWELGTAFEIDGVKLPSRQLLALICSFTYRDPNTCQYNGPPIADISNKLFVGGAGTYGFSTLNNRGLYDPTLTYNSGDYTYITSTLPALKNIKLYYVCLQNGVINANQGPNGTQTAFVADACPRSINACKLHFPAPLPLNFGGYAGVSRAPYLSAYSNPY
jgi:lambda family phage minor tail protein L